MYGFDMSIDLIGEMSNTYIPSPALSVKLEDNSFTKDEFTVVNGLLTAKWDKINQYPCVGECTESYSMCMCRA